MNSSTFKILFFLLPLILFSQKREIPIDTIVYTSHSTTIKGQTINYIAETGTQPVWNKDGKPIATLFYTCLLYTSDAADE